MTRRTICVLGAIMIVGCRSEQKPQTKLSRTIWRTVGSWSGRGNAQTESFEIGFEQCRIDWEAQNESPPGTGKLRIAVHSAVSGRELAVPVDNPGAGHYVAYVGVDPHLSYLVIESTNVDWSVKVEEPTASSSQ